MEDWREIDSLGRQQVLHEGDVSRLNEFLTRGQIQIENEQDLREGGVQTRTVFRRHFLSMLFRQLVTKVFGFSCSQVVRSFRDLTRTIFFFGSRLFCKRTSYPDHCVMMKNRALMNGLRHRQPRFSSAQRPYTRCFCRFHALPTGEGKRFSVKKTKGVLKKDHDREK